MSLGCWGRRFNFEEELRIMEVLDFYGPLSESMKSSCRNIL